MANVVEYVREGEVGVITVNNPPVNAASHGVRAGLTAAIASLEADADAKAGLIVGAGRTFIAGADIAEFGKPMQPPGLPDVVNGIERCAKPVVVAIHGTALGGGLEVALGCHYRVALASARVGLPEVHLGIIPGAGGTQRTPRLTGPEAALDLITTGRHAGAKEALEIGLIDEIAEGDDPRAAGLDFAKRVIAEGRGVRRTGDLTVEGASDELFAKWREAVAKKARGQLSPVVCVDAVAASVLPIDHGMARERELFQQLYDSPQRAALVHAFFGERIVAKVPEAKAEPRQLETIGVVGGGTMGAGITAAALNAGLKVVMVETDAEGLARGVSNLHRNYESSIAKGRLTEDAFEEMLSAQFSGACDLEALEDVDLVIEAVFENMEVKKEIFRKLDGVVREGAVLASNTSYLNIDEIAAVTERPEDVLGLHFFSPAHIMRLLEVVVGEKTAPETAATGFLLGKKMKKVAIRSGVCDGFIGNRILASYLKAAAMMVEDGASPFEIDKAVVEFGYPMGPNAMGDLAGLDIGWANRKNKEATRDPANRYTGTIADRICEKGWFGQKTGKGFYVYEDGARHGPPNPEIMPIVEAVRKEKEIEPREFTHEEIMRRYIAAMVNEAAKVVGEGIALRPVDVDMAALFGYGFPRWRGGPMHYADHVGLDKILADLREFAAEDAKFWAPAPLLVDLVESGRKFEDLNNA